MRWIFMIFFWLWAVTAHAGAWPREAGSVFIAFSADHTRAQVYAEYGLKGDWSLGVEVSMPRGRRLPDVTSFIHYPVWRGAGGAILSAGTAMEQRETQAAVALPQLKGAVELAARAGLFWGKGFQTPWGDGWATVDLQVEKLITMDWLNAGLTYKLDAGIGLKPMDRLMLMAQAQAWRRGGEQTVRVETSVAWAFRRMHLVLSPSVGVIGPKEPRLKLGLWVEF
jgi:hypothetical protein